MAFDELLAARVRSLLIERDHYVEKKMFGGICFMLQGNMVCGVIKDCLIARVGPAAFVDALKLPGAAVFDFTGRPMTGWVQVAPHGIRDEQSLAVWVHKGVSFALSLPAK
jgi:hypothetical protein